MAFQLDTNIPLLSRGTDVGAGIQQGLEVGGMLGDLQRAKEAAPIRQQILEQQAQQQQLVAQQAQQQQALADQDRVIGSIANSYSGVKSLVDSGKFNEAADALEANREVLRQSGVTNFNDTDEAITAFRSNDPKAINRIKLLGEQAIQLATDRGIGEDGLTTEERTFESLTAGFSAEDKEKARKIRAGISPRAVGSAAQTTAETGKTDIVAKSQAQIAAEKAAAVETAKLDVQKELLPSIRADIKAAEKEAQSKGEAASELSSAKAAMPGLRTVVSNLKALSGDATFTLAGKGFNAIAKELGFSTKGDTARSSMIAMVDNQVLPLLKPIFGAAFTAAEGDRLRNAFLDPDSTPDSRVASLNAFLAQMERNVESKERQLGQGKQQDTGITEDQFRAMSPEQRAEVIRQLQRGQ